MTDIRTDQVPPYRGDHIPPGSHTTITTPPPRSGMGTISFILGGVVVLLAVLWFALSGGDVTPTPETAPSVTIENNAAPEAATPPAVVPEVAPPADVTPAPAPEATTPAPDVTPAPETAPTPEPVE